MNERPLGAGIRWSRDNARIAEWLYWLVVEDRGKKAGGRPSSHPRQLLDLALSLARSEGTPPTGIPCQPAKALFLALNLIAGSGEPHEQASILQGKLGGEVLMHLLEAADLLISNGQFSMAAALVKPLELRFQVTEDLIEKLALASLLSIIARESQSSQTALGYLRFLDRHRDQISDSQCTVLDLSTGNCLKDQGRYSDAEEAYERALRGAERHSPSLRGAIYLQLGRLHMEAKDDIATARQYFQRARTAGFHGHYYAQDLLLEISDLQAALLAEDLVEPAIRLPELLEKIGTNFAFHEESLILELQMRLATLLGDPLAAEWSSRLAVFAKILGGRERETGSIFASMARSLIGNVQGAESRYWFAKARQAIDEASEDFHRPGMLCSLAYIFYIVGLEEDCLTYSQRAESEARRLDDRSSLSNILAQMSYTCRRIDPVVSRLAEGRLDSLLRGAPTSVQSLRQRGYLIGRRLLHGSPEALESWPEALRVGISRLGAQHNFLQQILDLLGETDQKPDVDGVLPPEARSQRGVLYAELCGQGFLTFLRRAIGLPPADVVEWVLSSSSSEEQRRRIALEYMINPTAVYQQARRASYVSAEGWKRHLPRLRALMMRFFFLRDLLEQSHCGPYSLTRADLETARNLLTDFYLQHASTFVFDPSDFDPTSRGRPRNPTASLDRAFDTLKGSGRLERFRQAVERLPEDLDPSAARERLERTGAIEALYEEIFASGDILPTAIEAGYRPDNFLETELGDPIRRQRSQSLRKLPILAQLFQGHDLLCWFLVDLDHPNLFGAVSIETIPLTPQEALEHLPQLRVSLARQTPVPSATRRAMECLLGPVLRLAPQPRDLLLRLPTPWSTIPLEQIPIDEQGTSLARLFESTRCDRFARFLEPSTGQLSRGTHPPHGSRTRSDVTTRCVWGDPLGDDPRHPHALRHARRESREIAELLGVEPTLGSSCTRDKLLEAVQRCLLLHLGCHCGHLADLGDFPVLYLADDYLIGQELAGLDLSSCRLAVLSACDSGRGEVFGTAPVESMAEYLLEAGVETVVASQWRVDDAQTVDAMQRFYQDLVAGERVARAARAAFGHTAGEGKISPWVVLGKNQSFDFLGEEARAP